MQKGQLGHGDLIQRNVPTEVTGLSGKIIVTGEETVPCSPPAEYVSASVQWSELLDR